MYNRFTERAQRVIRLAQEEAKRLNHDFITPEHILLGLMDLDDGMAATIISNLGIHTSRIRIEIEKTLPIGDNLLQYGELPLTPKARKVLEYSIEEAQKMAHSYVGTEHILLGLLKNNELKTTVILENFGLSYDIVKEEIINLMGETSQPPLPQHKHKSKTPTLDEFGRDLTEMAKEGKLDPVIGRDDEIDRLIQVLSRRTKNNPVLVGDPGVGKTAIVEGLAQRIINQDAQEMLLNKRIVTLDLSGVVAGTKYRGEFEQRLKNIIDEIRQSKNNIILFIDELHTVIGAGAAEGAIDASNMLKPPLARGELQCIGATTFVEYRKYIEHDAALERRFQPITVNPPSVDETIRILHGLKEKYEIHHKVKYADDAIFAAVELSNRYITERYLPDKAIDLLDEAGSRAHLNLTSLPQELKNKEIEIESVVIEKDKAVNSQEFEKAAKLRDKEDELRKMLVEERKKWRQSLSHVKPVITNDDVANIVSKWTNIPLMKLTEKESERLMKMEEVLHKRIIGQDEAIISISHAIRRARTGLKDPRKPIGTFIFLGPTGVGKTELARTLADFMFGHEDALVRFDMSEYMEKFSVSNLIGAPPGYVGYDEGGQLTEQVRRKPYSVVLLDEIEKAHRDVFNVLLQVFDDGRLTDGHGRTVDFKNTIIVMTSNIASQWIQDLTGPENEEELRNRVKQALKEAFRPEFLNRIDETIIFHGLSKEFIKQIADIQLKELQKRLAKHNYRLTVTNRVKEKLTEEGFDPHFGARPLKRTIQQMIENPLSIEILEGRFTEGSEISADMKNGKIVFTVSESTLV